MQAPTEALAKAFQEADASSASLSRKLRAYAEASREIIPEVLAAYDRMVERAASSDAAKTAPAVGDEMPEFVVPDQEGRLVTLSSLLASGPLVVSFNRGHWCPYCRLELRALKEACPAITDAGAQIVSIVPETAEHACRMVEMSALPFRALTDLDLSYALSLGLVSWVGSELKDIYAQRGIDLPRFQANELWMVPIPATFVVGQDGRVKARFIDADFRRRMEIDDVLKALRACRPA